MRGRSTINFRAKTLFACSAKVPSAVGDRCGGIPATGRAVGHTKHARAARWLLNRFLLFTGTLARRAASHTARSIVLYFVESPILVTTYFLC